ncbi:MAG TPA: serine protease, partial [Isosphaeraceae bacterium]|nr:serine protease [Isosphaeraceae bacterium]
MRTFLAILIGCVLAAASAYAEDKIPAQTLAEIKEATVFVKADLGQIEGSGSGFVIKTEGDNVYVVTNDHVISPPKSATRVAQPVLSLVFKSGTKDERSVSAEVVASDPARDLAVLKASGLNPAPKPIDLREASEVITETMPVYIFGFPFGQALATSKASPAITVARGSVSSIRRDDREQVAVVQIDGAINPGNSGGPVVDARGRLVGVAVARIQDAQIGLAIPCEELAKMLNGRIVALTIRAQGTDKDGVEIKTAARLIDPLHKIKTVSVHIVQAKSLSQSPKRGDDGTWPALPDARRMDLEINDQTASAVFRISSTKPEKTKYLFQMSYVNGDGKLRYTNPIERLLDFSESSDVASRSGDEPKGGFAKNLTRSGDEAKGGFTNNRDQTSREPKGGFGKSSGRTGGGFARDDSPKISPTKEPLKGTTRKVADIDVTELKLDAK